jgi:hypothetical protein
VCISLVAGYAILPVRGTRPGYMGDEPAEFSSKSLNGYEKEYPHVRGKYSIPVKTATTFSPKCRPIWLFSGACLRPLAVVLEGPTSLSTVVDKLQRHRIVLRLESRDDRLQVIAVLSSYPDGLALNLWAYFGEVVSNELADLTRKVL